MSEWYIYGPPLSGLPLILHPPLHGGCLGESDASLLGGVGVLRCPASHAAEEGVARPEFPAVPRLLEDVQGTLLLTHC